MQFCMGGIAVFLCPKGNLSKKALSLCGTIMGNKPKIKITQ